jgi:hypothetical protein
LEPVLKSLGDSITVPSTLPWASRISAINMRILLLDWREDPAPTRGFALSLLA